MNKKIEGRVRSEKENEERERVKKEHQSHESCLVGCFDDSWRDMLVLGLGGVRKLHANRISHSSITIRMLAGWTGCPLVLLLYIEVSHWGRGD